MTLGRHLVHRRLLQKFRWGQAALRLSVACASCIFLPFFQRYPGFAQCSKQGLVQAFVSQLAIEAFDEAVFLRFSERDTMPIGACILNPCENGRAGELSAVV